MRDLRSMVVAAVLVAAACSGDTPRSESQARPAGGTVVIAGSADLQYPNALIAGDVMTQEVNRYLLYLTLLEYSPSLEYRPRLARSWTFEADTAVTFELRRDVRWHDGEPTTAHDVAFTFRRLKDPATGFPLAGFFERWTEVAVQDSYTVRLSLDPHADPLAGWAILPIMPEHALDTVPAARMRTSSYNQQPVGNGPFQLVRRRVNDEWVFERNPAFPDELGRPRLDRVVWRVVPEQQAQLTALLTGTADLITTPPAERFDELASRPEIRGLVRPSRKYTFIGWNGRRPPLGRATVRRALSQAIDRRAILDALRAGRGELAVGPIDPSHWAFDATLSPLPYAPERAERLLRESGLDRADGRWTLDDGRPFSIELLVPAENDFSLSMAEVIQADLADIGVDMQVRRMDWNTLVSRISTPPRDFDAVLLGWEGDVRLNLRDLFHSRALDGPFQLAGYRNPELDSLLDSVAVLVDRRQALPLWHRIQAILREDQPWTFLYYYPDLYLVRRHVRGIEMDVRGALRGITEWWLDETS